MAVLKSINPTNGKILGEVKIVNKAKVEEAAETAREAIDDWKEVPLKKRGKMMLKLAGLLEQKADYLGRKISLEMGKPLSESRGEVEGSVENVKYLAKEAMRVLRDEVLKPKLTQKQIKKIDKLASEDILDYLRKTDAKDISVMRYDAVGVVAVIKPWNYPISTALMSIVPALIAGNVVIFKPSEETPLISNELAKLIWQAGVPKNVFQILQGRGQVGSMLVDSEIDMVSFTGSSEVGKVIAEKCSQRLIKYCLELGGSSAAIVLRDADLELATDKIIQGRFGNCGQICSAIKRVIVEELVADKLIELLIEKVNEIQVGDPLDKKTNMGPLVSQKQLKKLQDQVTRGVIQGGRIVAGGRKLYEEPYNNGWFHEATLMIHLQPRTEIMQEEVFGPILTLCRAENMEQAIEYANQTEYGLTAAVFTSSKRKADKVIRKVEVGTTTVNTDMVYFAEAPWSGLKESGFGVGMSKHGIWEFVHKKHVYIDRS